MDRCLALATLQTRNDHFINVQFHKISKFLPQKGLEFPGGSGGGEGGGVLLYEA